ncbi:T9SS type A sorting domain-containing protein [Neolewinella lacunae]|uniref:T9SS type A sorting domain-containing protein n=1 Tax=Neolewinella lacunae TaxID=1517758 RepID=A0A923PMT4_9BACT|nr:T9SS type A sorting domain-containing protein [Neolewinella lacunae]MBC6995601.1 T9SS type A sorting domain-containing protein [Neolewinella lacunae]MDN3635637.1 T9SS type A sorting domain-containing protein [Neolewinella lacunae]
MTKILRTLVLGLALLLTNLLAAQTDSVALVTIASVNITLDDLCNATVIPQEILVGEFDADGNGNLPYDAFTITVEDSDPSNGPVIDHCGTFRVVITAEGIAGFTTGWMTVVAEDKTPPVFTSVPTAPAGPLYCTAIEGIDLGLLANTVNRCYSVNTRTNSIVPGTLNPALLARLLAGGGLPEVTDNCSEIVEVCVNDIVTRSSVDPLCNDVELTRTFTATDGSCPSASGEENAPAVASYSITFVRPTLDDLDVSNIPDVVTIECDELNALGLDFGDVPAPQPGDLPFLNGPDGTQIPLVLGQGATFCNLGLTYEDSPVIPTCPLAYKVIRTYTVIDWCAPEDVRTFTQILKIGDFTPPTFTAPTQDLNFDGLPDVGPLQFVTNAGNQCGAYIRLDMPGIRLVDACSGALTLRADIFPNGNTNAPSIGTVFLNLNNVGAEISPLLPVGNHVIRYTYQDDCDNRDFTDVDIRIIDGTAPVAVCEDGLNVSLTAGLSQTGDGSLGLAVLTPEMLDNGSYDDCSGVQLAIGRVRQNANGTYQLLAGASYGQRIEVTCADLGEVLVGLRATDAAGNVNYCWLSVLVEDKLAPTCTPPAPVFLTCQAYEAVGLPAIIQEASDEELDAAFGTAAGEDNCEVTLTQTITGGINSCGVGTFTRTFTATDGEGFTNLQICQQRITVSAVHDYIISFPGDTEAFCRMTPNIGGVEVIRSACDLITTEVSTDTLESTVDECYKLRIEYLVINWCEYNTFGQPYLLPRDFDGDNNLRERTFLHLLPRSLTTTTDDTAVLDADAIRNNNGFTWPVDDGNDNDGTDDHNGNDNNDNFTYGVDNSRGAFRYIQYVKIYDEEAPTITENNQETCFEALGANCTGDVVLRFELTDECTAQEQLGFRIELDLDYELSAGFDRTRLLLPGEVSDNGEGDYTVTLANVPTGSHAIRVRGTDGCGNVDVEVIEFCVEDAKAPTPICIGQLTVTLMPNGEGGGNAAIWATDFIASEVEDCSGTVTYSIYTEAEANEAGFTPVAGRDGILLDCESDATVPVRVYAFDPLGRADYCAVFVLVQRAENACLEENRSSIGGTILSENGVAVGGVELTLTGEIENLATLSDGQGRYVFDGLVVGRDFTVDAFFDDYINHSQGISTFDLVLITRHILGLEDLGSPYRRLAADANNDEEITVQDIIAIRRLILGLDDSYNDNTAYRFVDAGFVFPVAQNPWATNFPEVVNVNNLAANVRDADLIAIMVGDASGDGIRRPRGVAGERAFAAENIAMMAGNTYEIALEAGATAGLAGVQGTFVFGEGVRITGLDYGQLEAGNVNPAYLGRGMIPFSFHTPDGLATALPLLRVTVVAERNVTLREVLSVNSEVVYAEGYTAAGQHQGLAIDFGDAPETEAPAALLQNVPNPVKESTVIRFRAETGGAGELTIRDLTGKVVSQRTLELSAGENQVTVFRAELGAAGVFTYTLRAGDFTATRKMIVQ